MAEEQGLVDAAVLGAVDDLDGVLAMASDVEDRHGFSEAEDGLHDEMGRPPMN